MFAVLKSIYSTFKDNYKFWMAYLSIIMAIWIAYDTGQIVSKKSMMLSEIVTSDRWDMSALDAALSKDNHGVLIIGEDGVRYKDDLDVYHLIPSFKDEINNAMLLKMKAHKVKLNGSVAIDLTVHNLTPSQITSSSVLDVFVKAGLIALYGLFIYFIYSQLKTSAVFGSRFKKIVKGGVSSVLIGDVAGHDGAKRELMEVVDFLKNADRFTKSGARVPKGVLLYGPPGNGKTLLAKAIAGEASASFIEQEASSFVQLFVGAGAMAVRQLFEEARKNKPCVIFIDEIDALGSRRSSMGGSDERVQALNALLVEMDGFANNDGIVLVAATNRLQELDDALLRPGRFDRKVRVGLPNKEDRYAILKVHVKKLPHCVADLVYWSEQTSGFSGADLAGLVNEAAVEAARKNQEEVGDEEMRLARDRIMMGVLDLSMKYSERDRKFIAFHEIGHAMVRLHTGDSVEKISILPRGQSLGVTILEAKKEEQVLKTEQDMKNDILMLLGGRAAEELFCLTITGGASDDLRRASELARTAIQYYGFGASPYVSNKEGSTEHLEKAASNLMEELYKETKNILKDYDKLIHQLTEVLLREDELDGKTIRTIWNNRKK